jgi:hypothetical protein
MVSRKRLAVILSVEVLIIAVFGAAFYWYAYYGWWGEDFGPKSSKAIMIQSYSAIKDGSGFNLTLIILNSGKDQVTLGEVSMEEYREPPNGTYIPPHNWITIGENSGLKINQNDTATINICLSEDTVNKTGTSPQTKVAAVDGTFCQMEIDLLSGT